MSSVFWIWLFVGLKIPLVIIGWMIWRIIKDVPEQVVSDGEYGSTVRTGLDSRTRGPRGGSDIVGGYGQRRGDVGHRHEPAGRGRTEHRSGR